MNLKTRPPPIMAILRDFENLVINQKQQKK